MFIGGTDVEAETPILWPPDAESWLIWKDLDAGKDWGQEEKAMTEDEMVGWHHRLNGHGFGWTPGVGDEQGGLVCFGSWGHKESDMTERLNWTELIQVSSQDWIKASVFVSNSWRRGNPGGASGKESTCEFNKHGFDSWAGEIPWRRKWQSTPVFLPGKSHRQRSQVGYSQKGCKESDAAEHTEQRHQYLKEEEVWLDH